MLQAKSKGGNLITLATMTRAEIEQVKQQQKQFYCPICKEQVIIKAGLKMIPHFAHRSIISCASNEGGEGGYHEKGKLLLYQWLKKQNLQVELEVYLPEINQRPDLFLTLNNKKIAIEYQCTRIPIELVKKRNEGYKKAGITPIWILGATLLKRQSSNHLKVDQFLLQFIHQFSSTFPLILFYFCPLTLQFITVQDIYLPNNRQAIGKFLVKKLNNTQFKDIFIQHPFVQVELNQLWKKEKQQFRLKQPKHLYGNELAWYQWLYLNGIHREFLPSIVHLPIASQFLMKTPPWNWQSRLIIDMFHPLPIGSQISVNSCAYFLRKQLHHPDSFPLIHFHANPIEQYLQLLARLNIIKQHSPHSFTKINPINIYKNIEQALTGDEAIMNQLIKQNVSMIQK